jgi:hypothetical protein
MIGEYLSSVMNRMRNGLLYMPYLAVAIGIAGTSAIYCRQFVQQHIGPLYILEIIFLICFASFLILKKPFNIQELIRIEWPTLPFLCWGTILLFWDLYAIHQQQLPPSRRVFQHALIFAYPVMWSFVGGWLERQNARLTQYVFYVLLAVNILPNLWGDVAWNIALGPLVGIPFVVFIRHICSPNLAPQEKLVSWMGILAFGLLFYWPFYHMWHTVVQRTSVLSFIVMIVTMPFLLYRDLPRWRLAGSIYGLGIFIFIFAMAGSTFHQLATLRIGEKHVAPVSHELPISNPPPNARASISTKPTSPLPESSKRTEPKTLLQRPIKRFLVQKIEHGEDKAIAGNQSSFQMRTRRYMWRRALLDWKKRPWIGIGFIPEVPSYVEPGVPNIGSYEYKNSPPVSGPHNSYLNILVRMGIPGFLCFFLPACYCVYRILRYLKISGARFFDLLLFYIVLNDCIYGLFNVGFESPHRAFPLWLAFGILMARACWSSSDAP